MKTANLKRVVMLLILSFTFVSCQQKESNVATTPSHPVALSMSSYTVAKFSPLDIFVPKAYAAITDLKFCFKRLRFKKELAPGQIDTNDNVDLELGEQVISSAGLDLGSVSVPADTYVRIEFDLERDCMGTAANSVTLVNDLGVGNHSTTDKITIKFEGTFIVDGAESLVLDVQSIIDAANAYDGQGVQSLKEAMEAVGGTIL